MKSFFGWCRKYISLSVMAVIAAIVYILFFQENSIFKTQAYERTIDSLRTEIKVQNDSAKYYRELNNRMDNHDPGTIEQIVRERHNMNRINEDVYIFE